MNEHDHYKVRIYPNAKSPKMFHNKFLELLTRTHPAVITTMYLVVGFFLVRQFMVQNTHVSVGEVALVLVTGFFMWTLAEYLMHRFLYHKSSDASFDSGFHYMFHGIHHEYPNDEDRLVLPPVPSLLFAGILLGLFFLVLRDWAFVFGTGFLWGYLAYMNVHFIVHKYNPPKHFGFWWKHHAIHHFQQHDRAFGVTTSIWDRVFGTMPEAMRKTVEIERLREKENN